MDPLLEFSLWCRVHVSSTGDEFALSSREYSIDIPHPDASEEALTLQERKSLWRREDQPLLEELDIEKRCLLFAQVDPAQFIYFYDKYFDSISRFIYYKVDDYNLTEELVSKTFFHALHHLGRFRWQGVTFGAWLFRIARNEVWSYLRNKSYWKNDVTHQIEDRADTGRDQLEDMILSEEKQLIRKCILRLDEKSQDVLVLYYWENLTTRQIAAVLDLPEGTVKVTLMRSRHTLEKMLSSEGYTVELSPTQMASVISLVSGKKHPKT